MRLNKLKTISRVFCCLASALWSESQCMEGMERIEERFQIMERQIHDLNMTVANLNNSIVPIGAIMEYSGTANLPPNWLECNGQAVSAAQYPELWAAIGATYGLGQDMINTFKLPDRRGYVAVGIGTNPNTLTVDAGERVTNATAPNIALGKTFGEERHMLTVAELAKHEHNIKSVHFNKSCVVSVGNEYGHYPIVTIHHNTGPEARHPSKNGDSANSGDNSPHNNMQPSIFMKFYIRAK